MKEKRFILLTCVVAAIIFCVISCGGEGLVDEISDGGEEESPVNEPDTNDNLNTDTNNYLPEPEASLDINEDDSEQKFEEPPAPVDTDGDGVYDDSDAFPLDASESIDTDKDGVGDNSDNCKDMANPDQKDIDFEYSKKGIKTPSGAFVVVDNPSLGDACDPDLDGNGLNVTYVDGIIGSDTNAGTFLEPVKDLQLAINLAKKRDDDVYVAPGEYDITNVKLVDGVNLYGGYDSLSGELNFHDEDFKTVLIRNNNDPVTLYLYNFLGQIEISGFYITNMGKDDIVGMGADGAANILPDSDEYGCNQATVYIVNSMVNLLNNEISISGSSNKPCGVLLDSGAVVQMDANSIDAMGSTKAVASTGIAIVEAPAFITNNFITAGSGRHSVGIRMVDSISTIVNNTIDGASYAASPKTSYGILFSGGSLVFANNIIFTGKASDQAVLRCFSDEVSNSVIKNNILTTFPQDGTNAILINCEGEFDFTTNFALNGADVSANIAFVGADSSFIGDAGVDLGLDASTDTYGNVTRDFYENARPNGGGFDIGAVEK